MIFWWSSLLLSCLVSGLQGKSVKKGLCIPPGENFHCGDLAAFSNVRWEVVRVGRLVHLDVEDCSEELLRQQSYAIKNQLGHPKPLERKIPPLGGILLAPRWFFMA